MHPFELVIHLNVLSWPLTCTFNRNYSLRYHLIMFLHMQAIAEGTMSSAGKARRAAAVQALAKVVSWRMLPMAIITVLRTAVVTFLRSFKVLLLRQKASRGLKLPAKSVDVMGVHLSRSSVKRAQLVAIVAFSRLWRQSKIVAIRSILMSVRIALAALFTSGKTQVQPQ